MFSIIIRVFLYLIVFHLFNITKWPHPYGKVWLKLLIHNIQPEGQVDLVIIRSKGNHSPQMVLEELGPDVVSKSALEHQGVMGDPDVAQVRDEARVKQVLIREASLDSTPELGESGEELPSEELVAQIAVNRAIPTSIPDTSHVSGPAPSASHTQHEGEDFDALGHSDLLEDTKFYQDEAIKYQSSYYSISDKYPEQVHLLEEASGALRAAESRASQTQQELLAFRRSHYADIQQAVSRVVSQYQTQLNATQTCTHKHQVAIQQL